MRAETQSIVTKKGLERAHVSTLLSKSALESSKSPLTSLRLLDVAGGEADIIVLKESKFG